mmetsp:Transcript_10910/g.27535  ORF Transcript_10910/g.27535 Transcript_10910/m.27535 type:complete len:81 (-) Transcript_10910:92-334(-)
MEKQPGQVLIRWAIQRGTSAIPKSTHPERIAANIDVLSWELSSESMSELSSIEPQVRLIDGASWLSAKGPYRTREELWDE